MDTARDVTVLSTRHDTAEIGELLRSLGYQVVERVVQTRSRPDPATFLGLGKLREVGGRLETPPPFRFQWTPARRG